MSLEAARFRAAFPHYGGTGDGRRKRDALPGPASFGNIPGRNTEMGCVLLKLTESLFII